MEKEMNLKCLFKHDWEIVGFVESEEQLKENIRSKLRGSTSPGRVKVSLAMPIVNRVCLRCGKIDNSLEKAEERILYEITEGEEKYKARQKEAKWLWEYDHNRKSKAETKES